MKWVLGLNYKFSENYAYVPVSGHNGMQEVYPRLFEIG